MKISTCVAAFAAIFAGACATEKQPWKRPLTLELASGMEQTNVMLVENNNGIETTWFVADNSSAGAQYGLIGALVTSVMDGMINAGPSGVAQELANDVAVVAKVERLNEGFGARVKAAETAETYRVRFGDVASVQKITSPTATDSVVEVTVAYTLSEDATALKVFAEAVYSRASSRYVTPYPYKSIPKEELGGPLYRNSFTYESNRLAVPTLTPELKAIMMQSINDRFIKQYGKLPKKSGDPGLAGYNDALRENNNDTLTKSEASTLVAKQWLANDGELLFAEVRAAQTFIAKYVLLDMNSFAVPNYAGQDEIVEQAEGGRIVRTVGSGSGAGRYISSPGGLTAPTTYGNAIQVAKVHSDRAEALRNSAKPAKAKK